MHHIDLTLSTLGSQIIIEPLLLTVGDDGAPHLRLGLLGVSLHNLGVPHLLIGNRFQGPRLLLPHHGWLLGFLTRLKPFLITIYIISFNLYLA